MLGVSLASSVAFVATCVPAGFAVFSLGQGYGIVIAIALGAIAAFFAGALLLRRFWPLKD